MHDHLTHHPPPARRGLRPAHRLSVCVCAHRIVSLWYCTSGSGALMKSWAAGDASQAHVSVSVKRIRFLHALALVCRALYARLPASGTPHTRTHCVPAPGDSTHQAQPEPPIPDQRHSSAPLSTLRRHALNGHTRAPTTTIARRGRRSKQPPTQRGLRKGNTCPVRCHSPS